MKRINIALVLAALVSVQAQAQTDDMYFVPKKEKKVPRVVAPMSADDMRDVPAYYVGSSRSVDEYNRRGRLHSSYTSIAPADSSMADVIDFEAVSGIYPDSLGLDSTVVAQSGKRSHSRGYDAAEDDYRYCRRMQMFDGWYGGPWGYYYDSFYGPYWGAAWGGWYDPWLYGYAGWYGPWRYGYYGWGWPYYSPYYSAYYWGGWGWPGYWGYHPAVAVRRGVHTGTLQYYDRSNYVGGVRRPGGSSRGTYNRDNGFRDNGNNTYVGVGRRSSSRGFDNSSTFGNTPRYSQPSAPSFGGGSRGGSFGGGSFGGGSRGSGIGGGGVRMGRR